MTTPEPDVDSFIDALRSNLPNRRDEQRIRARLAAAGLVTLGVAAPAAASAATLGAGSKLAGLSWISKLGLATAVATAAVAVPVAMDLAEQRPALPAAPLAPNHQTHDDGVSRPPHDSIPPPSSEAQVEPAIEPAGAQDSEPVATNAPSVARRNSLPAGLPEPRAALPEQQALPSVAALPPLDAPVVAQPSKASSTLREETELMERALFALRQGDRVNAKQWLLQHAQRFPNGVLVRERERALARVNDFDSAP